MGPPARQVGAAEQVLDGELLRGAAVRVGQTVRVRAGQRPVLLPGRGGPECVAASDAAVDHEGEVGRGHRYVGWLGADVRVGVRRVVFIGLVLVND